MCAGLDEGAAVLEVGFEGRRFSGWKEGGGTSKALPLNTLSVVAVTFPPFRCRSHMISLRLNCGNICDNWSTCAVFTPKPRDCPAGSRVLLPEGFENNHRMRRDVMTMNTRIWGMFNVCSAML